MRVVLPSLLACLGAFVSVGDASAQTVLKLDPYGDKQFNVPVEVGGVTGRFLFDTGEGVTMISPAMAEAFGCEPWAHLSVFRMGGERLDAPRCDDFRMTTAVGELSTLSTLVYDLAEITGDTAEPLDGSLGLDAFDGRLITLRLAAGEVVIETPASLAARTASAIAVPIWRAILDWSIRLKLESRRASNATSTSDVLVASPLATEPKRYRRTIP